MVVTAEDLRALGEDFAGFWRENRHGTLTTLRRDGSPHVVAVGVTLDLGTATARVIASRGTQKVANVRRGEGSPQGARVAVTQVDRGRWSTLEGVAVIRGDRESVADAEARYAARYHPPRENPERVVIEIALTRILGSRRLRPAPR